MPRAINPFARRKPAAGRRGAERGEDYGPLGRWHEVTVVAQDPSVHEPPPGEQKILCTQVRVPADRLWPGPRSSRFYVVDYDASSNVSNDEADFSLDNDPESPTYRWLFKDNFKGASSDVLSTSRTFFAQNVYAIAARTLFAFEAALGRRMQWAFGSHQLYLVPHAFQMPNAFYSRDNHAIFFGYLNDPPLETCLSHDIVAHETTHAVLDGLRGRFFQPGYPDQAAFHEALADIVALLSVFSTQAVVEKCLRLRWPDGLVPRDVPIAELRKTTLFTIAEQFGAATRDDHGKALRESAKLAPFKTWKTDSRWREPHRRGEILVAVVMQTLLRMWHDRVGILRVDPPSVELVAEEGAKAGEHLLRMVIRAIDYCPPVEFEFEDLVDAILVSDAEVAPDDEHKYRPAIERVFGSFGILQPKNQTLPVWKDPPRYEGINFGEFVTDPDEVHRFVWQNASALGLSREYYTRVENVQPSVRVGPDGFVSRETVACYVQAIEGRLDSLVRVSEGKLRIPAGLEGNEEIQLYGGGVLVFDQFGQPKYHQRKLVNDWQRQNQRLRRLAQLDDEEKTGPIALHRLVPGRRKADW